MLFHRAHLPFWVVRVEAERTRDGAGRIGLCEPVRIEQGGLDAIVEAQHGAQCIVHRINSIADERAQVTLVRLGVFDWPVLDRIRQRIAEARPVTPPPAVTSCKCFDYSQGCHRLWLPDCPGWKTGVRGAMA
jgi:hypothetical protein